MRANNRYSRYVVAAREDGFFQINLIRDAGPQGSLERLSVCQYCLGELTYRNFSMGMDRDARREIVASFTVATYFSVWPRDVIDATGLVDEGTAPLNDYAGNVGSCAKETKNAANWQCLECQRDLSAAPVRRFLHVHHVNGVKYDNRPNNLLALCIECHAKQPGHGHMEGLPDLAAYRQLMT